MFVRETALRSLGSRLWDCSDNSRRVNAPANVPAFRSGATVPCAEESLSAPSFGQDEYQRRGIPQYGREWMAREDHV